jgi:excisionase family DNA binding protein
MTATAQLRLVSPTETRAAIAPEAQIINLTIENDEKLLLTVVEAAHRLGIGRTLMYELLGTGQIASAHIGRLHKVPADALAKFVERQGGAKPHDRAESERSRTIEVAVQQDFLSPDLRIRAQSTLNREGERRRPDAPRSRWMASRLPCSSRAR